MNKTQFKYSAKIVQGSSILESEKVRSFFPRCGEMIITSKEFSTFEECEKNLSGLLSLLSAEASRESDKNQVIVSRLNPQIDSSGQSKPITGESWDQSTVLKVYVADAEALKQSQLIYSVMSAITVNTGINSLVIT